MPATRESQARTDAFARVIGTWLVIVPGIIVLRASGMSAFASEFFENGLFVWFAGALLLFGGLLIIAFHQFWSSVAAVIISLFGWIPGASRLGAHGRSPNCTNGPLCLWTRYLSCGSCSVFSSRLLYLSYVGWLAKPASPLAKNNP
jgi:hypothetical protein